MNIRTLSKEKLDYKTGSLPVALYPEKMIKRKDKESGYYGRIMSRGKFNIETIADDLVVYGSKRSREEIISGWHETCAAIIDRLINGGTVEADFFTFSLQVKGLFNSPQDTFKKGQNEVCLLVKPTEKMQDILDNLKCKVSLGKSIISIIDSVYDGKSQKENECLTRGGFLIVKGQNIKILGNDDSVGLYFVPEDAQGEVVKLSENMIISNKPSELYCIIPEELKADTRYKINIVTKYSRNGKERKEAISCMNDCLLAVK